MSLKQAYLCSYNVAQAVGWAACLTTLCKAAVGATSPEVIFHSGQKLAGWLCLASLMETLHAAAGLVPCNVVMSFLQWWGRVNALFQIANAVPELHVHAAAPLMLLCWSIGETIRYPWYALSTLGACPRALTWLRYTAFIPIYPVGVVCEMLLMYYALPYLRGRRLWSVQMPNRWNFGFDYTAFITAMLFAYPFLWWGIYSTLLRQRKRKLGPAAAAGAKKEL